MFQSVNLVPFLTARENLDELGIGKRSGHVPAELSGGERQRVAIGRALMNEPKLVLFDEPTSALDTQLGEHVMELIRNEVKGRGTAAIIVTHDTRMTHYCDRVVTITDGHRTQWTRSVFGFLLDVSVA